MVLDIVIYQVDGSFANESSSVHSVSYGKRENRKTLDFAPACLSEYAVEDCRVGDMMKFILVDEVNRTMTSLLNELALINLVVSV